MADPAPLPPKPHRRWEVDLHVSADSIDDLVSALEQIALDICMSPREGSINMVSGGCASGWHVGGLERPEQTPERYRADLEAYLAARRQREEADHG